MLSFFVIADMWTFCDLLTLQEKQHHVGVSYVFLSKDQRWPKLITKRPVTYICNSLLTSHLVFINWCCCQKTYVAEARVERYCIRETVRLGQYVTDILKKFFKGLIRWNRQYFLLGFFLAAGTNGFLSVKCIYLKVNKLYLFLLFSCSVITFCHFCDSVWGIITVLVLVLLWNY